MSQPTERSEPVIDRDDDGAFLGELFAVIARLRAGCRQAGAVDPRASPAADPTRTSPVSTHSGTDNLRWSVAARRCRPPAPDRPDVHHRAPRRPRRRGRRRRLRPGSSARRTRRPFERPPTWQPAGALSTAAHQPAVPRTTPREMRTSPLVPAGTGNRSAFETHGVGYRCGDGNRDGEHSAGDGNEQSIHGRSFQGLRRRAEYGNGPWDMSMLTSTHNGPGHKGQNLQVLVMTIYAKVFLCVFSR